MADRHHIGRSPEAPGEPSSRVAGFYRLSPDERLAAVITQRPELSVADFRGGGLSLQEADVMIENVVGTYALPSAIAVNMRINGIDRFVPMVIEEPSVVAAVSNVARLAREHGGFCAEADEPVMIGQVQLVDVRDPEACIERLRAATPRLLERAMSVHPRLERRGGGVREFEFRKVHFDAPGAPTETMVIVHALVDCRDAMGANLVNTLVERLAPLIEEITGETVGLRILSNLSDRRMARASVRIPFDALGPAGAAVAEGIVSAWRFAWADPYRAATHNKGVMNGIDALAIATGNDWRAIEAGAHAWCARDGAYRPMTRWTRDAHALNGFLEIPLAMGTVGGPIRLHPTARANLALLGIQDARELSAVAAAVGLAQNLGALKALATEGIQAGHMRMHARCVAATAGANPEELASLVRRLVDAGHVNVEHAKQELERMRHG